MDASHRLRDRRGQSVLEFLLMMPMMLGLTALLLRVNTAMNMSIVNQQYARAQTLFLAFNSAEYPESGRVAADEARMTLGVSDNVAPTNNDDRYTPEPMISSIARAGRGLGRGPSGEEPSKRTDIRIRNTVSMCTPSRTARVGGEDVAISRLRDPVPSSVVFAYCRSKFDE